MKKALMILASVALGASMASAADVVSKNVVGMKTVDLPLGKYTAIGWQFSLVGGETNIPINSAMFTNYPNFRAATAFSSADAFRRYDSVNSTWVDYFRRYGYEWRKSGETVPTTDVVKPGEMILFIKRTTASQLQEIGEVMPVNVTIDLPLGKYVAICNPFPVPIIINSATLTNYPNFRAATAFSSADAFRRYDSVNSTWADYFRRYGYEWRKSGETVPTPDTIEVGEGFLFIKRTTASTITFNTPI